MHSSINVPLGCVRNLAIVKNAIMNTECIQSFRSVFGFLQIDSQKWNCWVIKQEQMDLFSSFLKIEKQQPPVFQTKNSMELQNVEQALVGCTGGVCGEWGPVSLPVSTEPSRFAPQRGPGGTSWHCSPSP